MRKIQVSKYGVKDLGKEEDLGYAQLIARAYPKCKSFYIPPLNIDKQSKDAYLKIVAELDAEAKAQGAVPLSIVVEYFTDSAILSGFDPDMNKEFDVCIEDNTKLEDSELPYSVEAQEEYLENVRQFYAGEAYDEDLPDVQTLYEDLCENIDLDDAMGDFEPAEVESTVTSQTLHFGLEYDMDIRHELDSKYIRTAPTVVVFFKVDEPHQVLGNTPIGGYGDMPDHIELCLIAKDWYEQYGIVPVTVNYNTIEFKLDPSRLDEDSAMELASKISAVLGFLPECYQSIGQFAYDLTQKQYFTITFDVDVEEAFVDDDDCDGEYVVTHD